MKSSDTFLWHDYETFGTHPGLDRPAQFAAIRTNADLEPVGKPVEWFCKPADDVAPHPGACLVTGITPQHAQAQGLIEAKFARLIRAEMMEPGTCVAGYNNIRFDDEFTRNLLYRNFYDPYEREWRNGNSRWDLINLARMCYALRPEGIEWPLNDKGVTSFKLEDLARANNIQQDGAHDALVDVRATIDLARLIKQRQPKLFDWALGMRDQKQVMNVVNIANPKPIVHSSSRIGSDRGCTSLFLPLALVPDRPKSFIAVDLMQDPEPLLTFNAQDISDRVFTSAADLPEGIERIALKQIHSNKVPMLAPAATLRGVDTDRIGLSVSNCMEHASQILAHLDSVKYKVMDVFKPAFDSDHSDPDLMLYSGGFFSGKDKALMKNIHSASADELASEAWPFQDARLPKMLFRYRARNYPESLNTREFEAWQEERKSLLFKPPLHNRPGIEELQKLLPELRRSLADQPDKLSIIDALDDWYQSTLASLG